MKMAVYGTKSNLDPEDMIAKAGQLAVEYKRKGFHCPEAVIRAIPEALGFPVPADVIRSACGFFGGGGGTGDRCGIVEAGIMLISYLYARIHPLQSEQNVRTLVSVWIARFREETGSVYCREIKPPEVEKYGAAVGCEDVYRRGATVLARLLLEADAILSGTAES